MKVENFVIKRFRNAEVLSIISDVIKVTSSYDWSTTDISDEMILLNVLQVELKAHLNRLSTVNETIGVVEADKLFDKSFRAFKYFVKGYELSPEEQKVAAAKVLIDLIKSHGWNLHQESYQIQNANANLFIEDCNGIELVQQALRIVDLTGPVGNIASALQTLETTILNRKIKTISIDNENTTKDIRDRVQVCLDKNLKYLEVMTEVTTNDAFIEMIKEINESINKIEFSINLRHNGVQEEEEQGECEKAVQS